MSLSPEQIAELHDLVWALRSGTASAEEMARLEQMVCNDPAARAFYVRYVHLCADLHWSLAGKDGQTRTSDADTEDAAIRPAKSAAFAPPILPLDTSQSSIFTSAPLSSFPSFLFAYLVAAVVLGTAVLVSWVWKMPEQTQLAQHSASGPVTPTNASPTEEAPQVGRVSGMCNCRWADPTTETFNGAGVPLGRKYALAAGLMEISYKTGANVILEGPCVYLVERESGGFLSLGKLTAVVEKRGEGRGEREEEGVKSGEWRVESKRSMEHGKSPSPISKSPNLQISKSRNPQIPISPSSPLFAVRTPTAIVADLGTEFGVECDRRGVTRSLVFRGSVRIETASAEGKVQGTGRVLLEGESAQVERSKPGQAAKLTLLPETLVKRSSFVHRMPKQTTRVLDLVDVVAGGNGFSGRRNGAINPADGSVVRNVAMADYYAKHRNETDHVGDGRYHRVSGGPFIDGVFIPDGSHGSVQVDSANHRFNFPPTANIGCGWIHAGGVIPCVDGVQNKGRILCTLGNVNYSSDGHGVLFIHSNKGITFDLDAIRAAHRDSRIVAFRAVAGIGPEGQVADLWVLVDGRPRFAERRASPASGALIVYIPLRATNHFLTLAATDGSDGVSGDFAMFGDPRLELISDDSGERRNSNDNAAR
jgi:hypothetical protein